MNYSNESSQAELVIPESNLLKSYSDKSESIESFNIISNMKDLINQTIQI
ncbi:MAG: hypothetical protein ACJA1A_001347, partial [Saprospiraceae bacterium]